MPSYFRKTSFNIVLSKTHFSLKQVQYDTFFFVGVLTTSLMVISIDFSLCSVPDTQLLPPSSFSNMSSDTSSEDTKPNRCYGISMGPNLCIGVSFTDTPIKNDSVDVSDSDSAGSRKVQGFTLGNMSVGLTRWDTSPSEITTLPGIEGSSA